MTWRFITCCSREFTQTYAAAKAVERQRLRLRGEIRYLDKLVDELAKGKAMEKILRG
jgi:hypothetical protein